MIKNNLTVHKINIILWCLVIYTQYILFPLKLLMGIEYLGYLVVVISVVISFVINGISKSYIKILVILTLYFILDLLLFKNLETFTFFYISMFSSSFLVLLFTLNIKDFNLFFSIFYKFSLIALLSISASIILSLINSNLLINYMFIGNGLSFVAISVCYNIFKKREFKKTNVLIYIYILTLSLFFGNRMSILTIYLLYLIPSFLILKTKKDYIKRYISLSIQFVIFVFMAVNIKKIILWIKYLLIEFQINSYSVMKIERAIFNSDGLLNGLSDSSSGRNILYREAIRIIKMSNFFPSGVSSFNVIGSGGIRFYYPHNIFLELLLNFGIFFVIVLFGLSILFFNKYKKGSSNERYFLLSFFIFSFTKSLVSSSIWLSPSLWILFGALVSNRNKGEIGL